MQQKNIRISNLQTQFLQSCVEALTIISVGRDGGKGKSDDFQEESESEASEQGDDFEAARSKPVQQT